MVEAAKVKLHGVLILLAVISGSLHGAGAGIPLVDCRQTMVLDGTPAGGMKMPTDIAIDAGGRIHVVDSANHRILVYTADGKYLREFGAVLDEGEPLSYPVGITISGDGLVVVADRGNKKIKLFNPDGSLNKSIDTVIGGSRYTPVDVLVNKKGQSIFVTASTPFHQVMEVDDRGVVKSTWGSAGSNVGEFRFPATMAINRRGDEIYIVDVLNTRVQTFDFDGRFLTTVGSWGVTPGRLFRPKGVALMKDNSILVSDSYLGVVQLFDRDTRFRAALGVNGEIARFDSPTGLEADDRDRVYIVETMANKVTVCQLVR